MLRTTDRVVLVLSGAGFPLTQMVIARFGRRGAAVVEVVSAGLLIRDAVLIGQGATARLRRGPAILLDLELAAATVAVTAGARPILTGTIEMRSGRARMDAIEAVRRAAVGTLFGLHTMRWRIYLSPDRGLRKSPPQPPGH
ncbi:MAG: hypothetical protein WCF04_15075 [Candidatus Nanopelagicales bacterium]